MPTVNVNGYDLYYVEDDFADPWRPHDTILMQHFVYGNHTEFRPWVPILAGGYRVIRMDRRGNGYSGKPPLDYQYNLDDLMSDFVGFLDALGIEKVHYIGQSLGGVLGAAFATTHPDRLKSLVLCATPCFISDEVKQGFVVGGYPDGPTAVMAMGSLAWGYAVFLKNRSPEANLWDDLGALYRVQQRGLMPPHVIASLMRMVSRSDFDITSLLPNIKAPTLLLSPGASHFTSLEQQKMMKEKIPNCEQVIFEDAPHMITWTHPVRCAEESLKFIRKHSG